MSARALLIGLDGATWDVIESLQDRLPNLWRLRSTGTWARLRSTNPPMTLPAWSSVLTGTHPETHGIVDFVRRDAGKYAVSFLDARDRRVPTIHNLLSAAGHRVASVAVPTTYPPESLNGIVIAGFDSPVATTAGRGHCAPQREWGPIVRRFGGLRYADFQEGAIGPGWHAAARNSLLREIGRKEALCAHLLGREAWELFMIVFGESDTAGHHFWMFHDDGSPRFSPDVVGDTVTRVYERLDAMVGRLAGFGAIVGVVSDHGFGGANTIAVYLNRFLEQQGWLTFRAARSTGRAGDAARRVAMKAPFAEALLRRTPAGVLGRCETAARYGDIDFGATRAWSDEMNYAATIHLNVRGRDPLGRVENVALAVEELTRDLLTWEVAGERVVDGVDRNPAAERGAADLTLRLATRAGTRGGAYSYTLLPSTRVAAGTTWRTLSREEHVGGKGLGMNGAHRPLGILALSGPMFRAAEVDAGVEDVAPTLLTALGHPVPAHMQGRSLLAGDGSAAGASAVIARSPPPAPRRVHEDRALERRLSALGYL